MNSSSPSARLCLTVESLEQRDLPSSSSYVSALYTELLHRPASAPEVAAWVRQLDSGMPAAQVTNAFVTSPEYLVNLMENDYEVFLQRTPQVAEVLGWAQQMQSGLTEEQ